MKLLFQHLDGGEPKRDHVRRDPRRDEDERGRGRGVSHRGHQDQARQSQNITGKQFIL